MTELHKEIDKLQKRIRNQDEQLQKADEMNQEMLELKPKHWLTTQELRIKHEQLQQAETDNQQLRQENQELQKQFPLGNSLQPDYEAARDSEALRRAADRTLNKLKVGRQSSTGKAIDTFIKELQKLSQDMEASTGNAAVNLLVDLAITEWKQHQRSLRYFEDLRRIGTMCGYRLFETGKGYEAKDIATDKFIFSTGGNLGDVAEWLRSQSPKIKRL